MGIEEGTTKLNGQLAPLSGIEELRFAFGREEPSTASSSLTSIPGLVICLDREQGRRVSDALHTSLGAAISPIDEFMGTDGREASKTGLLQPPRRTDRGIAHYLLSVPASDAISDSHMRAWEYFLEHSTAQACAFFEDDAFVGEGVSPETAANAIRGALKEVRDGSTACDVLFLGHFESPVFVALHWLIGKLTLRHTESTSTRFTREPQVAVGAHAYILTRKGAQKALFEAAYGRTSLHTSDVYLQSLASQGLIRTRVLHDRLVFQTSTARSVGARSSTSPGGQTAEWARKLGINAPDTHFPTLICDVICGAADVDQHVSARYLMAFEVVRLFRLPALSITTATLLLLAVVGLCAVGASLAPVSLEARRNICLVGASVMGLVVAPDLIVGLFSSLPFVAVLKAAFHMLILGGPLLLTALILSRKATLRQPA